MGETMHIVCPHCHTANRVPVARLDARPNCGRCHAALFGNGPVALDSSSFDTHAGRGELPLLVDFWAPWCGPCRVMAPQFERAAGQLEPRVRLAKVDTQANPELAARFGIRSIPTLALLRGGREQSRRSGALGADEIVAWTRSQL